MFNLCASEQRRPTLTIVMLLHVVCMFQENGLYHLLCMLEAGFGQSSPVDLEVMDTNCRHFDSRAPVDNRNFMVFYTLQKLLRYLSHQFSNIAKRLEAKEAAQGQAVGQGGEGVEGGVKQAPWRAHIDSFKAPIWNGPDDAIMTPPEADPGRHDANTWLREDGAWDEEGGASADWRDGRESRGDETQQITEDGDDGDDVAEPQYDYDTSTTAAAAHQTPHQTPRTGDGDGTVEESLHHKLADLLHMLSAMEGGRAEDFNTSPRYAETRFSPERQGGSYDYGQAAADDSQASKRYEQQGPFFLK
jgi:hypothetical protein